MHEGLQGEASILVSGREATTVTKQGICFICTKIAVSNTRPQKVYSGTGSVVKDEGTKKLYATARFS